MGTKNAKKALEELSLAMQMALNWRGHGTATLRWLRKMLEPHTRAADFMSRAFFVNTTDTTKTTMKRFVDNEDGTVTDTITGLMWMRCALGQTWNGETCTGSAKLYTYDAALVAAPDLNAIGGYAGYTDWGLPTIEELLSLVDYKRFDPAIDTVAFPNCPSSVFWSSSPYANDSSNAWYVYFYNGYSYYGSRDDNNAVRLVRGGQ